MTLKETTSLLKKTNLTSNPQDKENEMWQEDKNISIICTVSYWPKISPSKSKFGIDPVYVVSRLPGFIADCSKREVKDGALSSALSGE